MSRLDRHLAACFAQDRKILIPFITVGDPSPDATVPIMHALVRGGADVIELGVPFSDPMADGPVIQRSSERAIERGAGLAFTLQCVREFRKTDAITPIVLMGYLNPVDILGASTYAERAIEAGVDGTLLVDLPPEEATPFIESFAAHGLRWIALASPTTSPERQALIATLAEGYLYYVSYAGVTGSAAAMNGAEGSTVLESMRSQSAVPVVVGFGIRDAQSAVAMAQMADGVVIGSALVSVLAESDDPSAAAEAFVRPIRAALDAMR